MDVRYADMCLRHFGGKREHANICNACLGYCFAYSPGLAMVARNPRLCKVVSSRQVLYLCCFCPLFASPAKRSSTSSWTSCSKVAGLSAWHQAFLWSRRCLLYTLLCLIKSQTTPCCNLRRDMQDALIYCSLQMLRCCYHLDMSEEKCCMSDSSRCSKVMLDICCTPKSEQAS